MKGIPELNGLPSAPQKLPFRPGLGFPVTGSPEISPTFMGLVRNPNDSSKEFIVGKKCNSLICPRLGFLRKSQFLSWFPFFLVVYNQRMAHCHKMLLIMVLGMARVRLANFF